ncbi:DUF2589 domain-containing protein [Vibrio sp. 16]|uniref:DUF2589 domain-containing protein n=1 Tax=Vibrio sp. 16 TaxID=391586 RepID=UPI00018F1B7C|nr:DUF2589 domain-containing protein [Vibrio sp. 16]EED25361.1 alpha amylase, catalytic subdomain [Vibrio sp. 16]CAK4076522.1 DUF2589 domain-containing protein [Vibrio sp. 16]
MALVKMQNQFSGLPMESLIGTPLKAACDSQVMLARSTVDFIREVGFDGDKTRVADFSYTQNMVTGKDAVGNDIIEQNNVSMEVPVLAIVNVPSLMVDEVDITFDMEVKSSESSSEREEKSGKFSAKTKIGWGPVSVSASVSGSVASHKENTRKSDNSAKYHVAVHASQAGTPEGLSRVLDIIAESVAPKQIQNQNASENTELQTAMDEVIEQGRKTDLAQAKARAKQMAVEAQPDDDEAIKALQEAEKELQAAQANLEKANIVLQLVRQGQKLDEAKASLA